jgi:hypothetical protein
MGRGYKGTRCGTAHGVFGYLGTLLCTVHTVVQQYSGTGERGSVCHATDVPLWQRPFCSSHPRPRPRPRRTVVEAQRDLAPIKITYPPTYCSAQVSERKNAFLWLRRSSFDVEDEASIESVKTFHRGARSSTITLATFL